VDKDTHQTSTCPDLRHAPDWPEIVSTISGEAELPPLASMPWEDSWPSRQAGESGLVFRPHFRGHAPTLRWTFFREPGTGHQRVLGSGSL